MAGAALLSHRGASRSSLRPLPASLQHPDSPCADTAGQAQRIGCADAPPPASFCRRRGRLEAAGMLIPAYRPLAAGLSGSLSPQANAQRHSASSVHDVPLRGGTATSSRRHGLAPQRRFSVGKRAFCVIVSAFCGNPRTPPGWPCPWLEPTTNAKTRVVCGASSQPRSNPCLAPRAPDTCSCIWEDSHP